MAKDKTAYVCSNCGQESPKWIGKCPSCGQWNTFKEIKVAADSGRQAATHVAAAAGHALRRNRVLRIREIEGKDDPRYACVEAMKKFIGPEGSIIAQYDTFEKTRIKELADLPIPQQDRDFLLSLLDRFEDTCDVFSKYYFRYSFFGKLN